MIIYRCETGEGLKLKRSYELCFRDARLNPILKEWYLRPQVPAPGGLRKAVTLLKGKGYYRLGVDCAV